MYHTMASHIYYTHIHCHNIYTYTTYYKPYYPIQNTCQTYIMLIYVRAIFLHYTQVYYAKTHISPVFDAMKRIQYNYFMLLSILYSIHIQIHTIHLTQAINIHCYTHTHIYIHTFTILYYAYTCIHTYILYFTLATYYLIRLMI